MAHKPNMPNSVRITIETCHSNGRYGTVNTLHKLCHSYQWNGPKQMLGEQASARVVASWFQQIIERLFQQHRTTYGVKQTPWNTQDFIEPVTQSTTAKQFMARTIQSQQPSQTRIPHSKFAQVITQPYKHPGDPTKQTGLF